MISDWNVKRISGNRIFAIGLPDELIVDHIIIKNEIKLKIKMLYLSDECLFKNNVKHKTALLKQSLLIHMFSVWTSLNFRMIRYLKNNSLCFWLKTLFYIRVSPFKTYACCLMEILRYFEISQTNGWYLSEWSKISQLEDVQAHV